MTELDTVKAEIAQLDQVEHPGARYRRLTERRHQLEAAARKARAHDLARQQMADFDARLAAAKAEEERADAAERRLVQAGTRFDRIEGARRVMGFMDQTKDPELDIAVKTAIRARSRRRYLEDTWPMALLTRAEARFITKKPRAESGPEPIVIPGYQRTRVRDRKPLGDTFEVSRVIER